LVAAAACSDDDGLAPDTRPVLRIEVDSRGGDLDLDGYVLVVDGGTGLSIGLNEVRFFDGLEPGLHVVELDGVAPNCVTTPRDIRSVRLATADTSTVDFEVSCLVTGVLVGVTTSGLDPALSYRLLVDGVVQPAAVAPTGTTEVTRMAAGVHTFQLTDVTPNCQLADPAPRTATVAPGTLTPLEFAVACVASTGVLQVTAITDGVDRDVTGYSVVVDGLNRRTISANGSGLIDGVAGGSHSVRLEAVESNCQVAGEAARTIDITVGGTVRDTVSIAFSVSCTKLWQLAFSRGAKVRAGLLDGSFSAQLADGSQPAWSPDGQRLAFGCGQICIMNMDGSGTTKVETGDLVDAAAWSPDGARLAFVSYNCDDYYYYGCSLNGLFTIRVDGTGKTVIPVPGEVTWMNDAAWAPDGSKIAFGCYNAGGHSDVCVIRPDGTGFQRLTQVGQSSAEPAWSPDGTRIVFVRWTENRPDVRIMNADGSGDVSTSAVGGSPAWTPEGTRILFVGFECSSTNGCNTAGLASIKPDGTGRIQITNLAIDGAPAPRP
jgi:Tol biopolymer transport system component